MDRKHRLITIASIVAIAAVVIGVVILALAGKKSTPLDSDQALSLYQKAIRTLPHSSYTYTISTTKETVLEKSIISETATQDITYQNLGTDRFLATVYEELKIGDQVISSKEQFKEDTGYFSIADSGFRCSISADEFTARYAPLLLISSDLYGKVGGYKNRSGYVLKFTDPITLEPWVTKTPGTPIQAEGTVTLTKNEEIVHFRYNCTYIENGIEYTIRIQSTPSKEQKSVTIAEDTSRFTQISHPDAAKFLELSCAYLMAATDVHAIYDDTTFCQAFGDNRIQNIVLDTSTKEDWVARVITTTTLSNDSKSIGQSTIIKEENYDHNGYTIRINESEPTEDEQILQGVMREHCQNILIGSIMLPEYIASVEISEEEGILTYRYAANDAFVAQIRSDAFIALYQDPNVLNTHTQEYTTETAEFYLSVDLATKLPCSSGYYYTGFYTVDALPYRLIYNAEQTYAIK